MNLVPASHLELGRQRRLLNVALEKRDWHAVRQIDRNLMDKLQLASSDPQRDLSTLLRELRAVVGLYRDVVRECNDSSQQLLAAVAPMCGVVDFMFEEGPLSEARLTHGENGSLPADRPESPG